MEKEFAEDDLLNSTGFSSEDDISMDYELGQTQLDGAVKRQKLIDQFDALTLQDEFEMQFNTPNELNIQKIEPDCVFEEEIDSSKRRNKKWLKKNRKINYTRKENEYERTKFRKTLNKLRKTRKANLQKKYQSNYQEFESFKSLEVASKSQDCLDKKTLELFAKLKEVCPRIFKRLEKLSNRYSQKQICSGTQNGNFLFTCQQEPNDYQFSNLLIFINTQIGRRVASTLIEMFHKNLKSSELYIIKKNAQFSEEVIVNSLKKLEDDFDMIDDEYILKSNQLCNDTISNDEFNSGDYHIFESSPYQNWTDHGRLGGGLDKGFYEFSGGATIELKWSNPSISKQVIPSSYFVNPNDLSPQFVGSYPYQVTTVCPIGYTGNDPSSPTQCKEICGDAKRIGTEKCDDGNTNNGDGCNSSCTSVEASWVCSGGSSTSKDMFCLVIAF